MQANRLIGVSFCYYNFVTGCSPLLQSGHVQSGGQQAHGRPAAESLCTGQWPSIAQTEIQQRGVWQVSILDSPRRYIAATCIKFSDFRFFRPIAGSLTEARGQKANMHVFKEMLELCQIINTEGYVSKDQPELAFIPFGELFNVRYPLQHFGYCK